MEVKKERKERFDSVFGNPLALSTLAYVPGSTVNHKKLVAQTDCVVVVYTPPDYRFQLCS